MMITLLCQTRITQIKSFFLVISFLVAKNHASWLYWFLIKFFFPDLTNQYIKGRPFFEIFKKPTMYSSLVVIIFNAKKMINITCRNLCSNALFILSWKNKFDFSWPNLKIIFRHFYSDQPNYGQMTSLSIIDKNEDNYSSRTTQRGLAAHMGPVHNER